MLATFTHIVAYKARNIASKFDNATYSQPLSYYFTGLVISTCVNNNFWCLCINRNQSHTQPQFANVESALINCMANLTS